MVNYRENLVVGTNWETKSGTTGETVSVENLLGWE